VILVTGATGFIGSEILRRASRRGWRVRGLARHPDRAEALGRLPHVELYRGDVTEPDDLDEAMEGVAAVVHLVGIIVPTREQGFEEVHVGGTCAALEAAARAGVPRFVHMSALGAPGGRDATPYFRTKWQAAKALQDSSNDCRRTSFRDRVLAHIGLGRCPSCPRFAGCGKMGIEPTGACQRRSKTEHSPVDEIKLSRRTPSADAAPGGGPRGIGDVTWKSTAERLVAELPRVPGLE